MSIESGKVYYLEQTNYKRNNKGNNDDQGLFLRQYDDDVRDRRGQTHNAFFAYAKSYKEHLKKILKMVIL